MRFAMPELVLGIVPDAGSTAFLRRHLFSRAEVLRCRSPVTARVAIHVNPDPPRPAVHPSRGVRACVQHLYVAMAGAMASLDSAALCARGLAQWSHAATGTME